MFLYPLRGQNVCCRLNPDLQGQAESLFECGRLPFRRPHFELGIGGGMQRHPYTVRPGQRLAGDVPDQHQVAAVQSFSQAQGAG